MVMTCHHCDLIIARDAAGIPVFHGGLSPEGSPMRGTGRSPNGPSHMRRAIIRNGEQFNVSVTELLPGPNGTVATCQELPDLIVIGTTLMMLCAGRSRRSSAAPAVPSDGHLRL